MDENVPSLFLFLNTNLHTLRPHSCINDQLALDIDCTVLPDAGDVHSLISSKFKLNHVV